MSALFPTTRRSVVLALASDDAGERTRGFDTLVSLYWKPLYKYARVAWSRPPQDCEDLTQAFFARILESNVLSGYDSSKANFRGFLRVLFDRHAANETKAAHRLKRGAGQRHLDFESAEAEIGRDGANALSAEEYFHREWIRSVFATAVERLRETLREAGKTTQLSIFEAYDLDENRASYRELGETHGITETTVTNYLSAARKEFRRIVLDTLREATATDEEYRSEARALLGVEA
jgi:RNA polymerase sigma factor (sigma-70 family)